MFPIDPKRKIRFDYPLIHQNYKVLHFDEQPILFTGTNKYGNRILGSFVEEDDERQLTRYFHILVDTKTYKAFIDRTITYKSILENSEAIFVIEQNYEGGSQIIYLCDLDAIPRDYLPLDNSYCPEYASKASSQYSIALKGGRADANTSSPDSIISLLERLPDMLAESLTPFKKAASFDILVAPFSPGSFEVNFVVDIKSLGLFRTEEPLIEFLNSFIHYCITDSPVEAATLFDQEVEVPKGFSRLVSMGLTAFQKAGYGAPSDYSDTVKKHIRKTIVDLKELSDSIGPDFTSIEIWNGANKDIIIGMLDANSSETMEATMDMIVDRTAEVQVDKELRDYSICIYHLNVESRMGNAWIYNQNSESETMSKPRIKISGDAPLEETKYTESLYLNKWIPVKAKATRRGDRFRSLEIEFE
jgi:hypothetical protein